MSEINLTAEELEIKILRQLKEPVAGSEAFPSALIFDTMNEIYEEVFNQPKKQINLRVDEYYFENIEDTILDGAIEPADVLITLKDSSKLPDTGRILIDNEFIDYTANDGVNSLTCEDTAISNNHDNASSVRYCYSLPSEIDKEKAQNLNINNLPYTVTDFTSMIDSNKSNYRQYAIYDSYIILPKGLDKQGALFIYTPAMTRMTLGTDITALIPNNMRVALIVNGSVGKLMILDSQSGADYYYRPPKNARDKGGGQFYDALRKFYANYGRQTDLRNKKTSVSIYD